MSDLPLPRLISHLKGHAYDLAFRKRTSYFHCRVLREAAVQLGHVQDYQATVSRLSEANTRLREDLQKTREEYEKTKSALENVKLHLEREQVSRREDAAQAQFVQDDLKDAQNALEALTYGRAISPAPATELLHVAHKIVGGDRNVTHGDKERSFAVIAGLWNAYFHAKSSSSDEAEVLPVADTVSAADVAYLMLLMKLGRALAGTPVRDHFIDMAGYAAIAGELALNEGYP